MPGWIQVYGEKGLTEDFFNFVQGATSNRSGDDGRLAEVARLRAEVEALQGKMEKKYHFWNFLTEGRARKTEAELGKLLSRISGLQMRIADLLRQERGESSKIVFKRELTPVLYYSVIESETHWYIMYYMYHPLDYKEWGGHENDGEGTQLSIRKPEAGCRSQACAYGELEIVEPLAHDFVMAVGVPEAAELKGRFQGRGFSNVLGKATVGADQRPQIFVEGAGHGHWDYNASEQKLQGGVLPRLFNAVHSDMYFKTWKPGEMLVYRAASAAKDGTAARTYQLRDAVTEVWSRRAAPESFDQDASNSFEFGVAGRKLPIGIKSSQPPKINQPKPYWAWDVHFDGLDRGARFMDPAKSQRKIYNFLKGDVSTKYLDNPYLTQ